MTPSEPHRMAGNPPRPADWTGFFASDLVAANDFMAEHERLPLQERALGPTGGSLRNDTDEP